MASLEVTAWQNFSAYVFVLYTVCTSMYVFWHMGSLLGNDRERKARQLLLLGKSFVNAQQY
jgi:hypothetical protein